MHKIDDKLYESVASVAESRGWSWNKTAKELLSQAIAKSKKKKNFSEFFGSWTKEEVEEFDKAIAETEKIYPGEW